MPYSPEPREIVSQIGTSKSAGSDRGSDPVEIFDAGRAHARDLLRACNLEPDEVPDPTPPVQHAATEWAASGAMALTGPAKGPPRFACGPLASAARGAALVLQVLADDRRLEALDAASLLGERAALAGLTRRGDLSAGGSARLLPTRDGTLALNLPRNDDWHLIPAWLEDDLPCGRSGDSHEGDHDSHWRAIAKNISSRGTGALVERGRLMGLAIATAPAAADVMTRAPFFELQLDSQAAPERRPRRRRLLDLSTLWAGPLATSLLSMAGIDVLKIESPTRPDGARNGPTEFFDLMNADKRGCALDLHDTRDRGIFERLLESADIVVESARPRALSQLGYDAEGWVAERPGRIWTSITGYGRSNEWIAFGDDAAIAAGLAWSPAAEDTDPCFCADAIADPLTGIHVAAIVLAHLRRSRGGLFDVSLSGIAHRAATASSGCLLLPLEGDQAGWSVIDRDRRTAVVGPRARSARGAAPGLAPPDEALLSAWLDAPC